MKQIKLFNINTDTNAQLNYFIQLDNTLSAPLVIVITTVQSVWPTDQKVEHISISLWNNGGNNMTLGWTADQSANMCTDVYCSSYLLIWSYIREYTKM